MQLTDLFSCFSSSSDFVQEDIVKAMGLTGQLLMGQAVMVKSSEAEKNLAWEAAQQQAASLAQLNSAAAAAGSGPCKLLVSNLHINISVRTSAFERHIQYAMLYLGQRKFVFLCRRGSIINHTASV